MARFTNYGSGMPDAVPIPIIRVEAARDRINRVRYPWFKSVTRPVGVTPTQEDAFLPSPATELPSSPVVRNLVTAVPPLLSPPKRRQKVVSADGKTERGNNSRSRRRSEGGNEATDC